MIFCARDGRASLPPMSACSWPGGDERPVWGAKKCALGWYQRDLGTPGSSRNVRIHVSAGALDNLARVLRLDSIERIQFFQLALRQPVIVLVQPPVRN